MTSHEFVDADLSGALFREVDLTGARMYGVVLSNADIDGAIDGLRVNGVEVAPLIEAELDRLHPERLALRPTTPDELRTALDVWDELWRPTVARAVALGEEASHTRVNNEWSFVETRRHIIFVVDGWFNAAVLGDPLAFHPIGLPASFIPDDGSFGLDSTAQPSLAEVEEVLAVRTERLREYAATVTQAELDRVPPTNPIWSSAAGRTAINCVRVVFGDGWEHHRFAVRDLSALEAS